MTDPTATDATGNERFAYATVDGTKRAMAEALEAGRHPSGYAVLGRTGLTVSGIGFGGYRIRETEEGHRRALAQAIAAGCNLVDTSSNYGDGSSERLIGQVLPKEAERDGVVVVSKAGYVQGRNLTVARERERGGNPYAEMVRYSDRCWHCIHPDFLADQITASLDRLALTSIDVMLLHNPEYFLMDRARNPNNLGLEQRRTIYYERIGRAFEHLESEVVAGRIQHYGVSSNTLVVDPGRPDYTSVSRLLEIAVEVGGDDHHFSVVQLPLNLMELGALVPDRGGQPSPSVLQILRDAEIGLLTNRPLNALSGGRLFRLSDFQVKAPTDRLDRLVKAVAKLEDEFADGLGRTFDLELLNPDGPVFQYVDILTGKAEALQDAVAWDDYIESRFGPEVSKLVNKIDESLSGPIKMPWKYWLERYVGAVGRLIEGLRIGNAKASQRRSDTVTRAVESLVPDERKDARLSQRAVALLRGLDGVSSVLVGMRRPAYVSDMMAVLTWERFDVDADSLAQTALAQTALAQTALEKG